MTPGTPALSPGKPAPSQPSGRPPAPRQIDALIEEYAALQSSLLQQRDVQRSLQEKCDERKAKLLEWIEAYGVHHTGKSCRLHGLHHSAVATTATLVQVDEAACDAFRGYLEKTLPEGAAERFFTRQVSYHIVKGPDEVLRTLELPARIRNRVSELVRACFRVTAKAPSLRVDLAGVERG
ncbi:MAG: hypothetical protein ACLGQU_14080 [Acidobacteriota bacterium]